MPARRTWRSPTCMRASSISSAFPSRAWNLLFGGAIVIAGTLGISLYLRGQIHKLPAHKSMLDISEIIFQTCKTYLIQQGQVPAHAVRADRDCDLLLLAGL